MIKGKLFTLLMAMTLLGVILCSTSVWITYRAAFEAQKESLLESVDMQTDMIGAIRYFQATYRKDEKLSSHAAQNATLLQLMDGYGIHNRRRIEEPDAMPYEVIFAQRIDQEIIFAFRSSQSFTAVEKRLPWDSLQTGAIKNALLGERGIIIEKDYTGKQVLSAYEYMPELDLGVVVRVDMARIRAPFIATAIIVFLLGIFILFVSTFIFFIPLVRAFEKNEKNMSLQLHLQEVIEKSDSTEKAFQDFLKFVCEEFKWPFGHIYTVTESTSGKVLSSSGVFFLELGMGLESFYKETQKINFKLGEGFLGEVWESGRALWISDVGENTRFFRRDVAKDLGIRTGFSFPIKSQGEVLAVVELYSLKTLKEDSAQIEMMNFVSNPLGHLLEKKRTDEKLQKSENLNKTILKNLVDGVITINREGHILSFSKAATKIFGYKEKEVLGQNVSMLMPEPDASRHDYYMQNYYQTGNAKILGKGREVLGLKKDGTIFPLDLSVDQAEIDGKLIFTGLVRDITQEKEAKRKLLQFKTTLDQTSDSVFMFDPETLKFFYVNQAAINHIGYPKEELLNMTSFDIKPEFSEEKFRKMLEDLISSKSHSINFETIHRHKNGQEIPVDILLQYVDFLDGTLRFVAIIRDITERRMTEDALRKARIDAEQAARAKSEFLANMSHEIRTPMNGIIGTATLLEKTELSYKQQMYTKTIVNSGNALLEIVNEILDFSKIEAGKLTLTPEAFDLYACVDEIYFLLQPVAQKKGLNLELKCATFPEYILGDHGRLRQILINLLNNAIKFTDEGSIGIEIENIEESKHDVRLKFSIKDTGPGISIEEQDKIFESFSQADNSSVRRAGGTGLGLSICLSLIDMMGGELSLESELGQGSTFYFTLTFPIVSEEELKSLEPADRQEEDVLFDNPLVLVAEDVETNRFVIGEVLNLLGIRADMAHNGKDAVEMAAAKKYDMILMDMHMPVMDGLEATRFIRKGSQTPYIVALTANVLPEEREKCFQAGMDEFLSKPIDVGKLIHVMRKAGIKELAKEDIPQEREILSSKNPDLKEKEVEQKSKEQKPIDLSILDQFGASASKLVELTLRDADSFIEELSNAIKKGNLKAIAENAHPLKSIMAQVGGIKLSDLARELELKGKDEDMSGVKELFAILKIEYKTLKEALSHYFLEKE